MNQTFGGMPDGSIIQDRNPLTVPSTRRNPVIADIFGRLGLMERKGSGFGKIINAYENQVNYTEYGGLIPGQSEDDFFSCSSMPRNRKLMRVFKDVGLVEQLGSGMSRILRKYDREIFTILDHFIKVEFPADLGVAEEVNETKVAV